MKKYIKNEINYSDDKMNGYFKEYAPNGSLVNTTKYINGVLLFPSLLVVICDMFEV